MYSQPRIDPRIARIAEQMAAQQVAEIKRAAIEQIAGFKQRLAQFEQQLEIERAEQAQLIAEKTHLIAKLEGEVAQLEQAIAQVESAAQEAYLHQCAELDNTRKRLERTFEQRVERANASMLVDFIGVMDNLELALRHANGENSPIREGVEATVRQWQQTLAQHGIRPIQAQNQPFNPTLHDAIASVVEPDVEPETVIHVEQTGYTLGDKLLRPARVVVAQGG
jgi:molecular chaperone GrpE